MLAGFVLARAAAALSDQTISLGYHASGADPGVVRRPLCEKEAVDADP